MVQLYLDIHAFNQYMEVKYQELHAKGQTDLTMITHLFQGYKAALDELFVEWIKHHHDNVDNGIANFTAKQLMQMAMCKIATWSPY